MDIIDILHTAIKIEQEGIEFYSKSANKVKDENGKGTLLFLANEEKRHKAFFEGVLKKHGKEDANTIRLLMSPRIFPEPKDYEGKSAPEIDKEILNHALETEHRSITFYSDAKKLADEKFRDGLDIVIREEKQHAEWIEYLLEGIRSQATWSPLHGHFSLDGG
ncbi:MAG: ferritin family protein [Candidatus Micrarchaeota archaeon]